MRIAIFGTGGVGGYFGGRLAQAGEEVTFIARGAHLAAIRERGLRVESVLGNFEIRPARATDQVAEVGVVDWIICGVKAWQVSEVAPAMRPMLGAATSVLPLENGVEAADQIGAVLGRGSVVGGVAWIGAQIASAGVIRHSAIEPRIAFGEMNGERSPRVERLQRTLEKAGIRAEVSDDIVSVLWSKFVFIAALSGVGAVARVAAGELREVPETRALLTAAMEETAAVARARGVKLATDIIPKTLGFVDGLPAGALASMQRDILEGRPSELEAQNGAVVRLGREAGVPTPVHAFIYGALLPQERRSRQA